MVTTRIAPLLQRAGWLIAIGALLCIQIAPLPLKLLGVLALLAVAWYRPDITLPLVPATAPLYLIPVALTATAGIPLAAFAGHTNVDLLDRAKAAGADPVVARGQAAMGTGKVVEAAITARRA